MKSLFPILILTALLCSCDFVNQERINGNGNIKKESRNTGGFDGADISGEIELYVKNEPTNSVKIETDENLLSHIVTELSGTTLQVYRENGFNLHPSKRIKVYISGPSFKSFEASGACRIFGENLIGNTSAISFHSTGASNIEMEINSPSVSVDVTGASEVDLRGQARSLTVDASGASVIRCFDLMTEETKVELSGASKASVFASVKLNAEATGASHISYKGNAVVTKSVSGAGGVSKAD